MEAIGYVHKGDSELNIVTINKVQLQLWYALYAGLQDALKKTSIKRRTSVTWADICLAILVN